MLLTYIKKFWELLNKISPTNRNFIIIILLGFVFYSLICVQLKSFIAQELNIDNASNKQAEMYTKDTAVEINRLVKLIANNDLDAFNVLLLSYHNSTQSLQGYKYLYLSCITEAPKELDTPLLKPQWDKIDYIYYADELIKIHNLSFIHILNLEDIKTTLPKLYRILNACDAKAASFYSIEGYESPIGMIVVLYKHPKDVYSLNYLKTIVSSILKLAILLDYDNMLK